MKNILTIISICFFSFIYGQQSYTTNENFEDRWDKYTAPSTNNYYTQHFKNYIKKDLISTKYFPKGTSKIILEFNLDSIYNIENLRVNTKNKALEDAIMMAFKEIDFGKVAIQSASKLHNYSLQILAIENGDPILKCSSSVLHEVPPIMEGCEQKLNYKDYDKCYKANLSYYIETAFDTTYILEKDIKFYPKVSFGKNGQLSLVNIPSNNALIVEATKKSVEKFNQRFRPATLNGVTDDYEVDLVIDSDYLYDINKTAFFENTSTENELAKHFKNQIPSNLIHQEQLNLKHNYVNISFSYNKQNKIENIKTSAENKDLNDALVNAFKLFPSEKLNVTDKNLLSGYAFQVIAYEHNVNIIKCSYPVIVEVYPVFDNCEKSKTIVELRKCNQESLSKYVAANFNINLARGLQPGIKRIFAIFKISKTGEIIDIAVRAPNNDLRNETIRILKRYKIISPGYQRGKAVNVKYSLPIAFKVDGYKGKDFTLDNESPMKSRYQY